MTYADTDSATSSLESDCGVTPCGSPDGLMTDLFSLVPAPVNPSLKRASSAATRMSATSGLRSSPSSASAALERSLANRLPALLATPGGIAWRQTWKAKVTPLRRRILAHTQSGLLTSDSGCTGWPTPNAGPQNDSDSTWKDRREALKAKHKNGNGFGMNLGQAAMLSPWPTPAAQEPGGTPEQHLARKRAAVARGVKMGCDVVTTLSHVAQLAAWPTATTRDWKSTASNQHGVNARPLNEVARLTAPGPLSNGSPAQTEKRGPLNPEFSRWLMGVPAVWENCAPTAMPSSRRLLRRSSKQLCKEPTE